MGRREAQSEGGRRTHRSREGVWLRRAALSQDWTGNGGRWAGEQEQIRARVGMAAPLPSAPQLSYPETPLLILLLLSQQPLWLTCYASLTWSSSRDRLGAKIRRAWPLPSGALPSPGLKHLALTPRGMFIKLGHCKGFWEGCQSAKSAPWGPSRVQEVLSWVSEYPLRSFHQRPVFWLAPILRATCDHIFKHTEILFQT